MRAGAKRLTDIVLVGGGHTHVQVLRAALMQPFEGARLTLVVDHPIATYSGMVPGVIAGQYSRDEVEIDVRPLARLAGARFIEARALRIEDHQLRVHGRPPVPFDVCSVNIGSTVAGLDVPGVREHAVATRPIARLVERWELEIERLRGVAQPAVVVVGAGAGGVELAFCAQARLRQEGLDPQITLVHGGPHILPTRKDGPRRRVLAALERRGIELRTQLRVTAVHSDRVVAGDVEIPADVVFWATGAAPRGLMRDSGLPTDARGFGQVSDELLAAPDIFAVGDCAVPVSWPEIPKAGVYAVRQGPVLIDNLRRRLAGEPLQPYRPQRDFFSLLNLGDGTAIGAKWGQSFEGSSAWWWKDRIDRAFMDRFQVLSQDAPAPAFRQGMPPMLEMEMVCGGCAAKVGQSALQQALAALPPSVRGPEVVVGLEEGDDAAVITHGDGLLIQSVDVFTAFTDDPWLVGRVAALNALSDLEVKGATPRWALAVVNVPTDEAQAQVLTAVLRGAREALDPAGVALLGGHSTVGDVLSVGFSVTGTADALPRETLAPGQILVLSRPLGTGVLWRADGLGEARGRWMRAVVAGMLRGNGPASHIAREHGATAMTDITGFGLAGHLASLCRRHGVSANLEMDGVPALPGAQTLIGRGMRSTFHEDNREQIKALAITSDAAGHPRFELLFDPQTAGGLVAAVPADRAAGLLAALRATGEEPAVIGVIAEARGDGAPLHVR